VFEGTIPSTIEVVPEARSLLQWAQELNIPLGDDVGSAMADMPAASARPVTPDDCLRAIAIKGFAQLQGIADAVLSTADAVRPIVDQLVIDGLAATVAGAYRLTDAGAARAAELLAADRSAWGEPAAAAALDAFLELDHRMKDAVTAWQLRDAEAQVLNDHSDPEYDRAVLDRLGVLHIDASAWLTPLRTAWPRIAGYGIRLDRAAEAAAAGDGRFVASPRVDSYHGIWFELHEELIRLAGRTREGETAAGRA
jgi:pyruvate,orthophosphate dikinase